MKDFEPPRKALTEAVIRNKIEREPPSESARRYNEPRAESKVCRLLQPTLHEPTVQRVTGLSGMQGP